MRARPIGYAITIGVLSTNGAFYFLVYSELNDSRLLARLGPVFARKTLSALLRCALLKTAPFDAIKIFPSQLAMGILP
jgi:hypothetical protein